MDPFFDRTSGLNLTTNLNLSGSCIANSRISGGVVQQSNPTAVVTAGSNAIHEIRFDPAQPRVVLNQSNTAENVFIITGAAQVTLPAGLWEITGWADISVSGPHKYRIAVCNSNGDAVVSNVGGGISSIQLFNSPNNTNATLNFSSPLMVNISVSTTYFTGINVVAPIASNYTFTTWIRAIRMA